MNFALDQVALAQIIGALVFLAATGMLIWEATFIGHPGPTTYYNHFISIAYCILLGFGSFELSIISYSQLVRYGNNYDTNQCSRIVVFGYWIGQIATGIISIVCFILLKKTDCIAITALSIFIGLIGFYTHCRTGIRKRNTYGNFVAEGISLTFDSPNYRSGAKCIVEFFYACNALLKAAHLILNFTYGILLLDLLAAYKYTNPGQTVSLLLPSHGNWNINYYCTSVNSSNATSYPTIWFESSIEHGIVDFFGLQIIIAQNYSRNSCSYDPPNFGWSSRLPADLPWDYDFFPYLLSALNRTNEDRVFVGWGTGNQFAIRHAIANPNTTKGLVMIDPEPMGIDALVQRGPANWTNQHLQLVYGNIMTQKISSVRISLSWLFVGHDTWSNPENGGNGYYIASQYDRYYAQFAKEDMYAMQYYAFLQQARLPINSNVSIVPTGMPTYVIMANQTNTDQNTSISYRNEKLKFANHVAGGNLTLPVVWYNDTFYNLNYTIGRPFWTVKALMGLGI